MLLCWNTSIRSLSTFFNWLVHFLGTVLVTVTKLLLKSNFPNPVFLLLLSNVIRPVDLFRLPFRHGWSVGVLWDVVGRRVRPGAMRAVMYLVSIAAAFKGGTLHIRTHRGATLLLNYVGLNIAACPKLKVLWFRLRSRICIFLAI